MSRKHIIIQRILIDVGCKIIFDNYRQALNFLFFHFFSYYFFKGRKKKKKRKSVFCIRVCFFLRLNIVIDISKYEFCFSHIFFLFKQPFTQFCMRLFTRVNAVQHAPLHGRLAPPLHICSLLHISIIVYEKQRNQLSKAIERKKKQ